MYIRSCSSIALYACNEQIVIAYNVIELLPLCAADSRFASCICVLRRYARHEPRVETQADVPCLRPRVWHKETSPPFDTVFVLVRGGRHVVFDVDAFITCSLLRLSE